MNKNNETYEDFSILINEVGQAIKSVNASEDITKSVDFIMDYSTGKLFMTYRSP